jgi:hypothetical protein
MGMLGVYVSIAYSIWPPYTESQNVEGPEIYDFDTIKGKIICVLN